ncbi:hypothetical protein [Streptacidiphilus sp. P02-A3a]|uniref:hypothetical protein n=1 Tax=Streptacidiphilus sp. P02-A3a TaxID=2704468 RepID=UPI0015FD0FC1|nr:hypothetical protein [Streptacidiphilus sp. P02-A3a]QMU68111.1 hypothetical protein GXP74_07625 [Streptacidiphilus sp. P02-A3a]
MYSEPELSIAARMRKTHAAIAEAFGASLVGTREAWGWRGRTLGRPVTTQQGAGWLRLVEAPAAKAGGKLWEGPAEAESSMPAEVPRPRLRRHETWTDTEHGYLAELYDAVTEMTVTTDSPVLRTAVGLGDEWWSGLSRALDAVSMTPTARIAVRQEYLDRAMPEFLGVPIATEPPAWSTAHGDLHWANLTAPALHILDWEGWGIAPVGYDAAMLHTYSLLIPETATRVWTELACVLDTPSGRFSELVVITQLLQTIRRGDNLDMERALRTRLALLLAS